MLEPVPTTGLTTADVPELITRVQNSMLNALRLISDGPSPATQAAAPLATVSADTTPPSPLTKRAAPAASVDGSTADGSDEDAVLVDRP